MTQSKSPAEVLKGYPLFSHLEPDVQEAIGELASFGEYRQGELIVEEGKLVSHLFIVIEGDVRVSTHAGGQPIELRMLESGDYFGEVSLLSGKAATATVEALSPRVIVVGLARDVVLELLHADERVRRQLEGSMMARAKDTIAKMLA